MHTFDITANDAGKRLDAFLRRAAPALPPSMLYKALRTKRIKRNHGRCEGATRLCEGDRLECWLPGEFFAPPQWNLDFMRAGRELRVLFEDGHVLLLDKPAGLLSHPDENEYVDTLLGRAQRYLYENKTYRPDRENAFAPALVNRIDRNTRGIVIAAKTAEALRVLGEKMKARELRKFYLCAVHGAPAAGEPLPNGWRRLRGWLKKDERKSEVKVFDRPVPGAKESVTDYRVLAWANGLSLLEIELRTGRTHQRRAQLAAQGHALLGDGKYAPRQAYQASGRRFQALCSWRLVFAFRGPAGALEQLRGLDLRLKEEDFVRERFGEAVHFQIFRENF
jgi:23S rRNA pseudouridine955/2504/2580 synthase